jgi:hypothetical protein
MKSGFKDPIADNPNPKYTPVDGVNSPWDWRAPQYDERSSSFIKAGEKHGVGYRNPVGHEGNPKQHVDTLPFGHKKAGKSDEHA